MAMLRMAGRHVAAWGIIAVTVAASPPAIGPRVYYETNFSGPELAGWESEWVPGVRFGPVAVVDGALVAGPAGGYRDVAAATRALKIDGREPFMVEFGARTEWEIKIVLFSTWDTKWSGYMFHLDNDSYIYHPRVRIFRMDRGVVTMLGSYDTSVSGSFRFDRDREGNWTFYRDGFPVPEAVFRPDKKYVRFIRLGVLFSSSRRGSRDRRNSLDWLRIGRP